MRYVLQQIMHVIPFVKLSSGKINCPHARTECRERVTYDREEEMEVNGDVI